MDSSDVIALLALAVSGFTFYWTSIRERHAFYLVRVQSYSSRMEPEFALINGGDSDILVTSILCAFRDEDGKSWYAPDWQSVSGSRNSFSLLAGQTHHCVVTFLEKDMNEKLAEGGEYSKNGSTELYLKDMMVIVEWVNSKGKEYKAEANISRYGFEKNGQMRTCRPLEKHHDLYKICS